MLKEIKLEKSKIEQEIQANMKDHEVAFIGDRKITWKWQSRTTLDSKRLKEVCEYRNFVKDYFYYEHTINNMNYILDTVDIFPSDISKLAP